MKIAFAGLALVAALPLATCSPRFTALNKLRVLGVLRVATIDSPTTCYEGPSGKIGYECDLLKGLARKLGVALELTVYRNASEVLDAVVSGRAELGAAAINVTDSRRAQLRFSAPLQQASLQLVYGEDGEAPPDLDSLSGRLVVIAGSSAAEQLAELKKRHPNLHWQEAQGIGTEELLAQVADGALDYTVANSDLVSIDKRYYPQLRTAFDLSGPQPIAWALPLETDDSLYRAVQDYLQALGDGELARLRDGYFAHVGEAEYQGVVRFANDVESRLPRYRSAFEEAAERYGLDWRMLAAIGYQESRWDPAAVSPTGVRGIMMLTVDAAGEVEIANRENPKQSILGGARYLQQILRQLPPEIEEPDRTWMALAAYNQGIAHLLDARDIAVQLGGNPNSWLDLRKTLPLLARERWYTRAQHGYARGRNAVSYVSNVRNYYDILSWMTNSDLAPASKSANAIAGRSALRSRPRTLASEAPQRQAARGAAAAGA
jgi:membrane-bound lytic murein transglycosylase F